MSKTGWYYKGQYLTNDVAKDLTALGFPIERKIEGERAMKYNEGDLVTIKLSRLDAATLNRGYTPTYNADLIIKHEPKPFDWKDVKLGMAFRTDVDGWLLVWFLCISPKGEICVTKDKLYGMGSGSTSTWDEAGLTRAPEHDIEVQS